MSKLLRVVATGFAVASLAALGWLAFGPPPAESALTTTEVTLWTAGATATDTGAGVQRALPDAVVVPPEAERVPDAAFLLRAFPDLQHVEIVGHGVEPADADALRGRKLKITWKAPAKRTEAPAIAALSAPRSLLVGQRLTIQGRLRGLPAGGVTTLNLENPDGTTASVEIGAHTGNEAPFEIIGGATVAPGNFEWKLRLGSSGGSLVLGVEVRPASLPRVLLLNASPSFETSRLQRWLAEEGARVTVRTRVSAEHVRFAAANGGPAEFASVDAALLAGFDVVIADGTALAGLNTEERAALEGAVRAHGIGVLRIGAVVNPEPDSFFGPGPLAAETNDNSQEDRLVRLRLASGEELGEPATTQTTALATAPLQRWLARDSQGRTLCAALPRGRGWVACSLVTDTWRWLQNGHPDVFATFWSAMLSAIARPEEHASGRWALEAPTAPMFADEPARLVWSGPADGEIPAAQAGPLSTASENVSLNLARDPREPTRATTLYWSARPGWHTVRALPDGAAMAFFVLPADALPEVRAERRRMATARLVEGAAGAAETTESPDRRSARGREWEWVLFAIVVTSAGYLWFEQRRSRL